MGRKESRDASGGVVSPTRTPGGFWRGAGRSQSQLATGLAAEPTFGARMNVWLASLSPAFQRGLVEDGVPGDLPLAEAWGG